jgi:hypothetical protein
MTGLAVLSSLFRQTYSKGNPEKSTSRGTITATIAQAVLPSMEKSSLVGWAINLYPRSLKRKAVELNIARESKRHNTKETYINF